jgi:DNA invertase Pin-like site-specific DNA recombinase
MNKITADDLARRACVYIRQSTPDQVRHNLESQRRQYALVIVPVRWVGKTLRSSMTISEFRDREPAARVLSACCARCAMDRLAPSSALKHRD